MFVVGFDWANRLFINGEYVRTCTDREVMLVGFIPADVFTTQSTTVSVGGSRAESVCV